MDLKKNANTSLSGISKEEKESIEEQFGRFTLNDIRKIVTPGTESKTFSMNDIKKNDNQFVENSIHVKDGITYKVINGELKEYKTNVDEINYIMPLFCPNCKRIMKKTNDKAAWLSYRTCQKCYIEQRSLDSLHNGKIVKLKDKIKNLNYEIDRLSDIINAIIYEYQLNDLSSMTLIKTKLLNSTGDTEDFEISKECYLEQVQQYRNNIETLIELKTDLIDKMNIIKQKQSIQSK